MKSKLLHLLAISVAILSTKAGTAQVIAPALGAASGFALFSAVGAINNYGGSATVITGDIGTNAGAFNGFPGGIISSGVSHIVDGASLNASIAVASAYAYVAGLNCDSNIAPALGSGQALPTGIYCTGGATTITGNLTFDAEGDPSAVFIVKVTGTLISGSSSEILLANGASLDNIFFFTTGAVSLGANSVFRGNILADGMLSMAGGATILGRGLVYHGAIDLTTNTVTNLFNISLPVSLTDFSATVAGGKALLRWTTASEHNIRDYAVERSTTATEGNWNTIGTVAATGSTTSGSEYTLVDAAATQGLRFYRLRMTDMDGSIAYSSIKSLNFSNAGQVIAYPTNVTNLLTVTGTAQGSSLSLTDMQGKFILEQPAATNGLNEIETSQLAPGHYLLRVAAAGGEPAVLRVYKQ